VICACVTSSYRHFPGLQHIRYDQPESILKPKNAKGWDA
jgi:hypothetical protein